jgi:hypothetical protein
MTFGWVSPLKSEVVHNPYVWYAIAACAVITFIAYEVPPINTVLDVQAMGWISWGIVLGASAGSLLTIQLLKKLRVILKGNCAAFTLMVCRNSNNPKKNRDK